MLEVLYIKCSVFTYSRPILGPGNNQTIFDSTYDIWWLQDMQNKITPHTIYCHCSASKLRSAIIRSLPTWTPGMKWFATWALYKDWFPWGCISCWAHIYFTGSKIFSSFFFIWIINVWWPADFAGSSRTCTNWSLMGKFSTTSFWAKLRNSNESSDGIRVSVPNANKCSNL